MVFSACTGSARRTSYDANCGCSTIVTRPGPTPPGRWPTIHLLRELFHLINPRRRAIAEHEIVDVIARQTQIAIGRFELVSGNAQELLHVCQELARRQPVELDDLKPLVGTNAGRLLDFGNRPLDPSQPLAKIGNNQLPRALSTVTEP